MASEMQLLPQDLLKNPFGLTDMPVGIEVEDKENELFRGLHVGLAQRAMMEANRRFGVSFSDAERRWIENFASSCFQVSYFIGDKVHHYGMGRLAFLYGLSEAMALHNINPINNIPERQEFDALDQNKENIFAKSAHLDRAMCLHSLRGETNPQMAFELLSIIHSARKAILDKKPYALVPFNNDFPYVILAVPIYILAKDMAYQSTYPYSATNKSDFLHEEQERGLVQTIYGECPPSGSEGYPMLRAPWSRIVSLYKDFHLRNTAWGALALGNHLIGDVTGIPQYSRRFLEGSDITLSHFFGTQGVPDVIYQEAVPKSIRSIMEKSFTDDKLAKAIVKLSQKYHPDLSERGFDYENVFHELAHVAMQRRLSLFAYLVQSFLKSEDRGSNDDLVEVIGGVAEKVRSCRDFFRLRAFFNTGDLDRFCQVNAANPNIYLKKEATRPGMQKMDIRESLAEIAQDPYRSVEQEIIHHYTSHDYTTGSDVFAGVKVHQPLNIGGFLVPAEAQLLPLEMASCVWAERTIYKVWRNH